MSWTELLVDRTSIISIFGDKYPTLSCVNLIEIKINLDRSHLLIRIDLNEFPENAPSSWSEKNMNQVQISLMAIEIKDLQFEGNIDGLSVNIDLQKIGDMVYFKVFNHHFKLTFFTRFLCLDSISAYCKVS